MKRSIWILLIALCFTGIVGCSASNQANSKIQSFWDWFQSHEESLYAMQDGSSPEFTELANQLQKIDERLGLEIGPAPDSKKELAVSANLRPELFSLVQTIVNDAPPLKKWKIVAFRQPTPPDILKTLSMSATAQGDTKQTKRAIRIAIKDMRFNIKSPAEITIFIKEYSGSEQEQYIASTLLQQAIGEYKFATEVSNLSFAKLTDANINSSLPFDQLGSCLDKQIADNKQR